MRSLWGFVGLASLVLVGCGDDTTVPSTDAGGKDSTTTDSSSEAGSDSTAPPIEAGGDAGPDGADAGPESGPGVTDADLPDVTFFDASDGGVCNTLVNGAPVIQPTIVVGTLPTGTGGAVEQGLYYLTAETEYVAADSGVDAGVSTDHQQETMELRSQGASFVGAAVLNINGTDHTLNIQAAFSTTDATLTFVCGPAFPPPTKVTYTFDTTAVPHKLHFYETNFGPGQDGEFVFTEQ